ncbi:glutamate 5-kinase [Aestuariibacter salexigens]|uniref:glutamate 5-kinase n=1 Tax=Aestuariibacter salexigens TaxID=226010 RepID=UPI000416901A|nr:glutamate 5-kinase [Aestuariibacter salexigens]
MSSFTWHRAVIKIGSALIAPNGHACTAQYLQHIARFITASREKGKEVIVVSSGSVAAGRDSIKVRHQPSIAEKQAMASIGQTRMMANWAGLFSFPCAQVLLTYDDLHNRTRYVNISNTLRELLTNHALPIVNENDTVAVNELKVGDNDNLAAYTALVAQADTLIICSDINGLYDADPRKQPDAKLIPEVEQIDEDTFKLAGGAGSSVGTGGMLTKLQAAHKCMQSGIQTLIVNGRDAQVFDYLSQGQVPGTLFKAEKSVGNARAKWLKHTLKSRGVIEIDKGAMNALLERGASLLPSGVLEVSGHFKAGDAVEIHFQNAAIAKGLAQYNDAELSQIKGSNSRHISNMLGYSVGEAIVHRDDMVLL